MTFSDDFARGAHWPLRIALSGVFLYHGLTKFPALEALADAMDMPAFAVAVLAAVEVTGAVFILFGGFGRDWMTRLGGLMMMPVMLSAIILVHLPHGWNSVNMGPGNMGRGVEFPLTLFMIALYFVIRGNHTTTMVREAQEEREEVPWIQGRPRPSTRQKVRRLEPFDAWSPAPYSWMTEPAADSQQPTASSRQPKKKPRRRDGC